MLWQREKHGCFFSAAMGRRIKILSGTNLPQLDITVFARYCVHHSKTLYMVVKDNGLAARLP